MGVEREMVQLGPKIEYVLAPMPVATEPRLTFFALSPQPEDGLDVQRFFIDYENQFGPVKPFNITTPNGHKVTVFVYKKDGNDGTNGEKITADMYQGVIRQGNLGLKKLPGPIFGPPVQSLQREMVLRDFKRHPILDKKGKPWLGNRRAARKAARALIPYIDQEWG